ncbi:MAG: hypothetical protein LW807_06915 [Proteobacteria bacterium]|jgi:hypothetical protein|nr:hypothetical protein [Pseudomonadota bacterium]
MFTEIITKFSNLISKPKQHVSILFKIKEILNTEDGSEMLEWLIYQNILNVGKISSSNEALYQQGKIDLIKEFIAIKSLNEEQLNKIGEKYGRDNSTY